MTRATEQRPEEPLIGKTRIAGQTIPLQRFASFPPNTEATGDVDAMCLAAGQSVGFVQKIQSAAEIVRELVEGANHILVEKLATLANKAAGGT